MLEKENYDEGIELFLNMPPLGLEIKAKIIAVRVNVVNIETIIHAVHDLLGRYKLIGTTEREATMLNPTKIGEKYFGLIILSYLDYTGKIVKYIHNTNPEVPRNTPVPKNM